MASVPETVVTGDAVVLDVQIAQLPVRALGALIDMSIIAVGYLIAILLWAATLPRYDDALTAAILIVFTVGVIVGYPVVMETATRGRSVGKMAMGLRVVSEDGGPERFRQALFRALAGFVEIWMLAGGPAVIASLLSAKGKRIGDTFAGTVVISERGPRPAAPPAMPPGWPGGRRLWSCPGWDPNRPRRHVSSWPAQPSSTRPFEPRWPTGSPPMWSRGSPRLPTGRATGARARRRARRTAPPRTCSASPATAPGRVSPAPGRVSPGRGATPATP